MFWEQDTSGRLHLSLVNMGRGPSRERIATEGVRSFIDDKPEGSPVSEEETTAELERVLTDPKFRCSERNKRFLRYVTEKVFEGATDKIKAYSIAVDVFGRPTNFDPIIDPIVRIEAMRLRSALSHYYEVHAQQSLLRIDLPKGGYVPTISRRLLPSPKHEIRAVDKVIPATRPTGTRSGNGYSAHGAYLFRGLAAALIASGITLAGFVLWQPLAPQTPVISERPRAILTVSAGGAENAEVARALKEDLFAAMSRFQTLTFVKEIDDPAHLDNEQTVPSTPALEATYQIAVNYRSQLPQPSLWWQVRDHHGLVLISRVEPIPQVAEERDRMLARLANHIAGLRGTISNSELRRDYAAPTLGNGCVLRAIRTLHSPDPAMLRTTRTCLEQTIKIRPGHTAAHAALSRLLPVLDAVQPSGDTARRALSLANTATLLSSRSAAAARAQMEALFHLGHADAAISAGRRALALNPYDDDAAAALARVLALTGRWDDAIPLIEKAVDLAEIASPETHSVLAMDAYRRGAYEVALAHVVQSNRGACCEIDILHLATLGQLEMQPAAQTVAASLQKVGMRSETSFYRYMKERRFDPAFVSLLRDGISKLGLPVQ